MRRNWIVVAVVALCLWAAGSHHSSIANASDPDAVPIRLVIPSLFVDAPVATFDLGEDLSMPAPQTAGLVAWYAYSADAGAGNTVMAGHRDWQRQLGVFYYLDRLAEDDDIWVQDEGGVWY